MLDITPCEFAKRARLIYDKPDEVGLGVDCVWCSNFITATSICDGFCDLL